MDTATPHDDEQLALSAIYERLDRLRAKSKERLAYALRDTDDSPQARSEKESYERLYSEEITKYDAAEHNLYFGRLDINDGEIRRIGRIGVLNDDKSDTTLLLDWRAPLSQPFYLATPTAPEGVLRRRHIRTRNRMVTGVNDETLELTPSSKPDPHNEISGGDVVNESALLTALSAARSGHMSDIVETIQREQDEIIRTPHRGVVVVQGAPGTGKTAVALHRAAFLLYTYRDTLARSGVLIIGPNDTFLNYIGQVLPSLGENGVMLSTMGNLFPGVTATASESRKAKQLKGSLEMVNVLKRAVRNLQSIPTDPIILRFDGYPLEISRNLVTTARSKARGARREHNQARNIFLKSAIAELAKQHASAIGVNVLDDSTLLSADDIAEIRDEMNTNTEILTTLSQFWPILTPQQVLVDLFSNRRLLRSATSGWSTDDQNHLLRSATSGFTESDAPLLDELAELLGEKTTPAQQKAQWRLKLAEAQEALDILKGSASQDLEDEIDPEILMAYDLIDAEQLAERQIRRTHLTTAERAYGDRTWTFGHMIIDEAQELSEMDWRMLMRRIPNRWITIIGDTAQTGGAAGTTSWSSTLEPYVKNRWKQFNLTVNYRTPSEIMTLALAVLKEIDPTHPQPQSIRSAGSHPLIKRSTDFAADAWFAAHSLQAGVAAILAPDALVAELRAADTAPHVSVLSIAECKGLEFDEVIVVEPKQLIAQSPRGLNDLYVALTRATKTLTVLHSEGLPEFLPTQ